MKATAEDRGKDVVSTSKASSRRAGRQQVKDQRRKSPTGKRRDTSPTSDVFQGASDADARCWNVGTHVPICVCARVCLVIWPKDNNDADDRLLHFAFLCNFVSRFTLW